MIVYLFLALSLVGSHSYAFYKGYRYANQDAIIRQQTAKLRHIEITKGYYRSASEQSKAEADKANADLARASAKLSEIDDMIKQGKLGKACSDTLFDQLRRVK